MHFMKHIHDQCQRLQCLETISHGQIYTTKHELGEYTTITFLVTAVPKAVTTHHETSD